MTNNVKINNRSLPIMLWLYTQERLKKAGEEGMTPKMGLEVSYENKRGKRSVFFFIWPHPRPGMEPGLLQRQHQILNLLHHSGNSERKTF